VSFVRVRDSFCSLDRRVHRVVLNTGCCKSVGDPGACPVLLLLFACVPAWVFFFVASVFPSLQYFLTLFPLLSTCFWFVVCVM